MFIVEPGDVVYCCFPTAEGGVLPHYALVLAVEKALSGATFVRVAYGSSRRVSISGALETEFVLADLQEIAEAGLRKPTRFDLRITARLPVTEVRVTGKVNLKDGRVISRLKRAILSAQWQSREASSGCFSFYC